MLARGEVLTNENPDDLLLARCRAGDLEAFALLYARHERQVFRYAYHQTGSRDDADDIKQETFVRAYGALSRFRRDSSVSTWLLKICANLCRDRLRSWEHRNVQYAPQASPNAMPEVCCPDTPHTLLERAEQGQLARRALLLVPPTQRELLVLHELEELSYTEIGQILDCSPASAKLRVFRARQVLRERFKSLSEG